MHAEVRLLEKAERRQIENIYNESQRWRGLAADDLARMVDALVMLTLPYSFGTPFLRTASRGAPITLVSRTPAPLLPG